MSFATLESSQVHSMISIGTGLGNDAGILPCLKDLMLRSKDKTVPEVPKLLSFFFAAHLIYLHIRLTFCVLSTDAIAAGLSVSKGFGLIYIPDLALAGNADVRPCLIHSTLPTTHGFCLPGISEYRGGLHGTSMPLELNNL